MDASQELNEKKAALNRKEARDILFKRQKYWGKNRHGADQKLEEYFPAIKPFLNKIIHPIATTINKAGDNVDAVMYVRQGFQALILEEKQLILDILLKNNIEDFSEKLNEKTILLKREIENAKAKHVNGFPEKQKEQQNVILRARARNPRPGHLKRGNPPCGPVER